MRVIAVAGLFLGGLLIIVGLKGYGLRSLLSGKVQRA